MTFLALIAIIFFSFAVYNLTCAFVDIHPDQEDLTNDDALPQTAGHQKRKAA